MISYRKRALEHRNRPDPTDALRRITAPHEWLIVVALLLSVLAALAVGAFWRTPVSLFAEGVLLLPGERGRIVSTGSGRVLNIRAAKGQTVAAGSVIAAVLPTELEARLGVATAKEDFLTDLMASLGDDPALQAVLAAARAERLELSALHTAGIGISSSRGGEITVVHVRAGDFVEAGAAIAEFRVDDDGPTTAVAAIPVDQARGVRRGQPVRIVLDRPSGEKPHILDGRVSGILAADSPTDPLAGVFAAGDIGRLVEVIVEDDRALAFEDRTPVRMEIVLDRKTPFALLFSAGKRSVE